MNDGVFSIVKAEAVPGRVLTASSGIEELVRVRVCVAHCEDWDAKALSLCNGDVLLQNVNYEEKAVLLQWIADVRAARFSNGLSTAEHANEPLQALPASLPTCPEQVALGERMYNDPRISLDGTISCATCHILNQGGVSSPDHRTSEGIYGQFGGVNARGQNADDNDYRICGYDA